MPTARGDIKVSEEFKSFFTPKGHDRRGFYITLACQHCGTRRTWDAAAALSRMLRGHSDGHTISTFCDVCGRGIAVQLFWGKQGMDFSPTPLFPLGEDLEMLPVGLLPWVSEWR